MNIFGFRTDDLISKRQKSKEEAKLISELKENTVFEKNDYLALIIAAVVTLVPVVIIVWLLYFGISMLFFG